MRSIIDLYSERKVAQVKTADNFIRKFLTAKTPKDRDKAEKERSKIYDNSDNPKLSERMEEAKQENIKTGRQTQTPLNPEYETLKEAIKGTLSGQHVLA